MISKQTINVKNVSVVVVVIVVVLTSLSDASRRTFSSSTDRQSCQVIDDCDDCLKNPICAWCKKSNGFTQVINLLIVIIVIFVAIVIFDTLDHYNDIPMSHPQSFATAAVFYISPIKLSQTCQVGHLLSRIRVRMGSYQPN